MSINGVVQIFIKNNVTTSVGPASNVNSNTNRGRMSCCIFNMNAHNRVLSAHSLRSKSDCVDSIFQKFFHRGRTFIFIVTSKRSHKCLFGKKCSSLNRSSNTDTDQQRRTCI